LGFLLFLRNSGTEPAKLFFAGVGFPTSISARSTEMHATPILEYLKKNGQRLDSEIAEAMGIPLAKVRLSISELSARGEISQCSVTRFTDGKAVEGSLCRVAGYIPPKTPGRKPGASV
jgi:hypothetical protein